MSAASLQTRVFYGLKTDIVGNAHFITDAEVLYPVGNVVAIHNIPQSRQKLIHLPDKHEITAINVAPSKKFVALCEKGDRPTISIYDLQTLKKKKTLGIPYETMGVTKFNCIDFTFDNKYLAAVTGDPDQTMLYYNWDKGKMESSLKVGNPQNPAAIVDLISCNPSDTGVMAIGGPHSFKFLTVSETVWRPYGFSKADNFLISSMTWLNSDRLLVGTKDNRILYMENGDLKNIYAMSETVSMNLKQREEAVIHGSGTQLNLESSGITWECEIRCLIAFQRGFAFALGPGTVIVFEKEGQHKYVKRNIYVIPEQIAKDSSPDFYKVNTINVNPSADHLIVTTGWTQLFHTLLWGPDLKMDPNPQLLKVLGQMLHYGSITGLAMCTWKPIFMTCGDTDRSVRLWDFETNNLVLYKQYAEDICSISLHPTGLFCLLSFSDKLRFMNILIDDFVTLREFPIRNCKTVAFSNNGHLFAAVNGHVIQVYSTISFRNQYILKGHTGIVKNLMWSQTDMRLFSSGSEGIIYEWDMCNGLRTGEVILKGIILRDVVVASDGSFQYCSAQDNRIREIKDSMVLHQYALIDFEIDGMIMGKNDLTMLLTCKGGVVVSVKFPLQNPIEYITFHIHSMDITKIALSYDEQIVVTTGADGTLCIWKMEGKVSKIDIKYTNEVLIEKGDLSEKIQTIKDLTVRMNEMETEHAYKMRQTEVMHNEKMREVYVSYSEVIEELKIKMNRIQEDHVTELNNVHVEIVKMQTAHEKVMQQMEIKYDARLITEYDKYQVLEDHTTSMRRDYEKRIEVLNKERVDELDQINTKYEAQLHEKMQQLEEIEDELNYQKRVHDQLLVQVEDAADKEIIELRTKYENQLYEEKQNGLKLKGEVGVMRNRYMASQKDAEDLRRQLYRVQGEFSQFQNTILNLEKDITDLKKEIAERDVTIHDKEKNIYDLKHTIQELEKFKFVLNYKIQELKNQIEPRDQEIKDLKDKNRDMETELVNLHKTNVSLGLQLHELKEKLGAAQREIQSEMQSNKRSKQLLHKIRIDLLDAIQFVQEPHALKCAVTSLYHKYSASDEFLRSRKADLDAQCEFSRQRDHLERTVAALSKQVLHETSSDNKDLSKITEDNITLILELNGLREELKHAQTQIAHMLSLLGLAGKNVTVSQAREKLKKACHGTDNLETEFNIHMTELQSIIIVLRDELKRILSKLPAEAIK